MVNQAKNGSHMTGSAANVWMKGQKFGRKNYQAIVDLAKGMMRHGVIVKSNVSATRIMIYCDVVHKFLEIDVVFA